MRLFFYQIILLIALPILLASTIYQAIKRKGGILYLAQRFGCCIPKVEGITTWFHCASLGEVRAALPLIEVLLEQSAEEKILITSNTPTGKFILSKKRNKRLVHSYIPWDFSILIKPFLRQVSPSKLVILETEIWPTLFYQCDRYNIPINIINARLSQKTLNAPEFFKALYKESLAKCKAIICQSELHANRFKNLAGNNALSIKTVGNLKWHIATPKIDSKNTIRNLTNRQHIVLVSSHYDEEIKVAQACFSIFKDILLVIIPRHPERRYSLKNTLKKSGYEVSLRSMQENITDSTQIYLADTIGEVQQLIYDATICIIGGSFIPHGGQNFLEAAALEKAIICGPNMQNFAEITEHFIHQQALLQCTEDELSNNINDLLNNDEKRNGLAKNAFTNVQKNKDIIQKYLAALSM